MSQPIDVQAFVEVALLGPEPTLIDALRWVIRSVEPMVDVTDAVVAV